MGKVHSLSINSLSIDDQGSYQFKAGSQSCEGSLVVKGKVIQAKEEMYQSYAC